MESVNTGTVSLLFSDYYYYFEKKGAPFCVEMCMHISVWKSGFDDGSPDGNDPLVLARQMAARGITLVCTPVSCLVPIL